MSLGEPKVRTESACNSTDIRRWGGLVDRLRNGEVELERCRASLLERRGAFLRHHQGVNKGQSERKDSQEWEHRVLLVDDRDQKSGLGAQLYTIVSSPNPLPGDCTASNGMFVMKHYVARTTVFTSSFALWFIRVALKRCKKEFGSCDQTGDSQRSQAFLLVEICNYF